MYIYFKILAQTCGNQSFFLHFQRQKFFRKVDAARFLDARGDEKQVINLERPNTLNAYIHQFFTIQSIHKPILKNSPGV